MFAYTIGTYRKQRLEYCLCVCLTSANDGVVKT